MDTKALEKEFDRKFVKKLQGFDYLEIHAVIQRLNDVLGEGWQFELEERMIDNEEIVQFGRLGVKSEAGEWLWKSQCGSKKIVYYKEKEHISENRVDYGNDFKAAASDCLKKCATLWGVGLYLYGEVEEDPREAVAVSIEKGEKKMCALMKCEPAELRAQHFGAENDNLGAKSQEELEGYLVFLRGLYDEGEQGESEQAGKESTTPGTGNDASAPAGDLIKLKNEASQAQAKALRDGAITKFDVDTMRMKHFGGKTFPNDADKLKAFIKELGEV